MTRRILIGVLVVACLAGLVVAGTLSATGEDETAVSGSPIVRQVPGDGATVLRQSEVGVELTPGWEGNLVVDGVLVPDEQLEGRDPTATNEMGEPVGAEGNAPYLLFFRPGPGKVVEELTTGRVCAAATYFRSADGPGTARTTTWCFDVD